MFISPLIINILIILSSIFFLHIYWTSPKSSFQKKDLIILGISSMCVFFVMTFPFTLAPGNIYDLRKIPIILATFYGSIPVGIILTIGMLGYRIFIGGIGAVLSIIVYTIMLLVMILLKKKFKNANRNRKVVLASFIAGGISLFGPVMDLFSGVPILQNDLLIFYLVFFLLNAGFMAICVYIIEGLIENYKLKETLIQKEKLHVIGELAASLAHEIRNPLTTSRGFMQVLGQEIKDESKVSYINYSIDEMDRALSAINDYLTFAKPEAKRNIKTDLQLVLENVINLLEPYCLMHGVTVRHELEECWIDGDKDKLIRCFVNLVKNGIESMPLGGEIVITLSKEEGMVKVVILDHGIGMNQNEIQRLGTPFYTTKEKGTGLGMMVVHSLIHSMNGTIEINSKVQVGTEVIVTFNEVKQPGVGQRDGSCVPKIEGTAD